MHSFCCLCRFSDAHRAETKEMAHRMDEERKEGQMLLRSMATGCNNKVDWQAIIKKAEELHHREQEWLRQQDSHERRLFVKRQHRALQKRRKYDSIGSFSINMLSYSTEAAEKGFNMEHKSVTSSMGSTKEDHDEDVSSMGSHGAPASAPAVDFVMESESQASSISEANLRDSGPVAGNFLMCPSSSSSNMDVIEDQLHAPDSDSI